MYLLIYKKYGSKGTIVDFFRTYVINFRKIIDTETVNECIFIV